MAKGKPAIELTNAQHAQMREVGAYYGGKGTTGSADSRERQSRKRKVDTIKAVYSNADDRRLARSKPAPKAKLYGPEVPKTGIRKPTANKNKKGFSPF